MNGIAVSCAVAVERPRAYFDIRSRVKVDGRHTVAESKALRKLKIVVFTHLVGCNRVVCRVKDTFKDSVIGLLKIGVGTVEVILR